MKKVILTILLTASVLALRADSRSGEILKKTATAFGVTSYRVEFTASLPGELDRMPGVLIVSGEKYYLDVYDSKVYFDGKTGYTYSETNEEVILENPDPNDHRLFANPAKIFQLYERDFQSTYKGNTILNGKNVAIIELMPKQKDSGYNTITVYAEPQNGMPVRMVYHLEEYKEDLLLEIIKVTFNVKVTEETFRFDLAKYPDVEVIDFR